MIGTVYPARSRRLLTTLRLFPFPWNWTCPGGLNKRREPCRFLRWNRGKEFLLCSPVFLPACTAQCAGRRPGVPGTEMEFLIASLVPKSFGPTGYLGVQKILDLGFAAREFVKIPHGLEFLSATLEVGKSYDGKPRGRYVCLFMMKQAA